MGCIIINYVASNIFLSWNELRFTCHFAFCYTNKDNLLL